MKQPFDYQQPTPEQTERIKAVRSALKTAHTAILEHCREGRERSLAVTKLEESSMWANKSIVFEELP